MAATKHSTPQAQLVLPLIEVYTEEWRPITGFEGYYDVSNLGRVQRRDTQVYTANPGTHLRLQKGRILRQGGTVYKHVALSREGIKTHADIHVLVLTAFRGNRPPGLVVNHKDGDKHNNKLSNLEWMTPRNNNLHAVALGNIASGHRHTWSRLTEQQVREIRHLRTQGISTHILSEQFGMSQSAIQRIVYRKTYKYLP